MADRQNAKAFTLVELLVVIDVIAVLVAILLPSLSRAREQAIRVQDLSNMRQHGIAYAQYIQDLQRMSAHAGGDGS
jgi:prepilin-type N-terminal cleavage/methylation domain-containing protein